jgi:hypothetical protein
MQPVSPENGLMLSSGVPIMNTVILGAVLGAPPDIDIEQLAAAIRDAKIPGMKRTYRQRVRRIPT